MNIFEGETLKRSCIFSQVETVILKSENFTFKCVHILEIVFFFLFLKKSFVTVEITNILTRELQRSYDIFAERRIDFSEE